MQEERKPVFATRNKMAPSRIAPPFSQLNSPLSPLALSPSPPSFFRNTPMEYVIYARITHLDRPNASKVEQPKVHPWPIISISNLSLPVGPTFDNEWKESMETRLKASFQGWSIGQFGNNGVLWNVGTGILEMERRCRNGFSTVYTSVWCCKVRIDLSRGELS